MSTPSNASNSPTNRMRMKIGLVGLLLCVVCTTALITRLFYLQIIEGEKYKQLAVNQQLRDTIITPHRGSIYDTNMKTLAASADVWNVIFEPANLPKNEETREKTLNILTNPEDGLCTILGISADSITSRADKVSYYEVLKRKVDRSMFAKVTEFIKAKDISCIKMVQDTKRYYPYEDLASTVLGFVNDDNNGAYGLESYYNKVLTGTEGRVVAAKNALNGDMPFKYQKLYESQNGNSLVLTIDETIQHFVEKHLEVAVNEHQVKERAVGIVMNVKTGEVLAMASKPDFNPNSSRVLKDPMSEDRLKKEIVRLKKEKLLASTNPNKETENSVETQSKINVASNKETDATTQQSEQPVVPINADIDPILQQPNIASVTENGVTTVDVEVLNSIALAGGMTEKEFSAWLLHEQNRQWRNKVISDPYEPGSVFKLITAAAALDTNSQTLENSYFCPGYRQVADRKIKCWSSGHDTISFSDAVMRSCNPAFIDIGLATGVENFSTYFDRFGLGDLTGIDLPGESENAGLYYTAKTMKIPQLASASFGQTFRISSIQLITAISAAINGGNLMQPYVVKQIIDNDKNIIESYMPQVKRQVISKETSALIRQLGERVVHGGNLASGRNSKIPGYRIGGKTGTSEKLDNFDENGVQFGNVLSFMAFAPADDPEIAMLVALDEPVVGNALSSTIAVPIVAAMLEDILPYMGFEPSFTEDEILAQKDITVKNYIGEQPHEAQVHIRSLGLKTEIIGQGKIVLKQIPSEGKTLPYGGSVIIYTDATEANAQGTVPDVVGKTAYDANRLIANAGFNINIMGEELEGSEKNVLTQDPPAGTLAETGSIVTVNFQPVILEPEIPTSGEAPADLILNTD